MLRPTLNEIIAGLQRGIFENLLPELTSSYAQNQGVTTVGVLAYLSMALGSAPAYDQAEIEDLAETVKKIHAIDSSIAEAHGRKEMEAAIAGLASEMVLGKLADPVAALVRGYLRRNLDRMRALLGPGLIARG